MGEWSIWETTVYPPGHLLWVSSSLCPGHQLSSLVQLQRQPALLGQLTMVSHWVLEDVHLYQIRETQHMTRSRGTSRGKHNESMCTLLG